jgi:hypothetical protein
VYRDPEPEPAYGASGPRADYAVPDEGSYHGGSGGPGDAGGAPAYGEAGGAPAYGDAAEADPYAPPVEPDTAPAEPVRGPFEPPPGQARAGEADDGLSSDTTPLAQVPGPGLPGPEAAGAGQPGGARPAAGYDDATPGGEGSAEKLEQIKDLYMTVEAIGDDNVDKHFDELMQRQRDLISDYFKETGIGTGKSSASQGGNPADRK